MFQITKRD